MGCTSQQERPDRRHLRAWVYLAEWNVRLSIMLLAIHWLLTMCAYSFINNELNLSNIKVYGFDYDASILSHYTIVKPYRASNDGIHSTHWLITPRICHWQSIIHCETLLSMFCDIQSTSKVRYLYCIAINHSCYSFLSTDFQFDPTFAIRGLHYGMNSRILFTRVCENVKTKH